MNAERKLIIFYIVVMVIVVITSAILGGNLGYRNGLSQLDTVDSNAYWQGYYVSCVQVAQLQESVCFSITQTEQAKVETP